MHKTHKTLKIAHRGVPELAPENTMISFAKAIDFGADMIELDVHLSSDNVPVVIHDTTVKRTTNGIGKVSETLFADLKKLDAGSWFSKDFRYERIPSLEEVLQMAKGKCKVLIELKKTKKPLLLGEKTLELILKYDMVEECVIHSFQSEVLKMVSAIHAGIMVQKLVVGNVLFFPVHFDSNFKLGKLHNYDFVSGVNPSHKFITKKVIETLHKKGMTVYVWTENDLDSMKKLVGWGVDGIITDRVDLLNQIL